MAESSMVRSVMRSGRRRQAVRLRPPSIKSLESAAKALSAFGELNGGALVGGTESRLRKRGKALSDKEMERFADKILSKIGNIYQKYKEKAGRLGIRLSPAYPPAGTGGGTRYGIIDGLKKGDNSYLKYLIDHMHGWVDRAQSSNVMNIADQMRDEIKRDVDTVYDFVLQDGFGLSTEQDTRPNEMLPEDYYTNAATPEPQRLTPPKPPRPEGSRITGTDRPAPELPPAKPPRSPEIVQMADPVPDAGRDPDDKSLRSVLSKKYRRKSVATPPEPRVTAPDPGLPNRQAELRQEPRQLVEEVPDRQRKPKASKPPDRKAEQPKAKPQPDPAVIEDLRERYALNREVKPEEFEAAGLTPQEAAVLSLRRVDESGKLRSAMDVADQLPFKNRHFGGLPFTHQRILELERRGLRKLGIEMSKANMTAKEQALRRLDMVEEGQTVGNVSMSDDDIKRFQENAPRQISQRDIIERALEQFADRVLKEQEDAGGKLSPEREEELRRESDRILAGNIKKTQGRDAKTPKIVGRTGEPKKSGVERQRELKKIRDRVREEQSTPEKKAEKAKKEAQAAVYRQRVWRQQHLEEVREQERRRAANRTPEQIEHRRLQQQAAEKKRQARRKAERQELGDTRTPEEIKQQREYERLKKRRQKEARTQEEIEQHREYQRAAKQRQRERMTPEEIEQQNRKDAERRRKEREAKRAAGGKSFPASYAVKVLNPPHVESVLRRPAEDHLDISKINYQTDQHSDARGGKRPKVKPLPTTSESQLKAKPQSKVKLRPDSVGVNDLRERYALNQEVKPEEFESVGLTPQEASVLSLRRADESGKLRSATDIAEILPFKNERNGLPYGHTHVFALERSGLRKLGIETTKADMTAKERALGKLELIEGGQLASNIEMSDDDIQAIKTGGMRRASERDRIDAAADRLTEKVMKEVQDAGPGGLSQERRDEIGREFARIHAGNVGGREGKDEKTPKVFGRTGESGGEKGKRQQELRELRKQIREEAKTPERLLEKKRKARERVKYQRQKQKTEDVPEKERERRRKISESYRRYHEQARARKEQGKSFLSSYAVKALNPPHVESTMRQRVEVPQQKTEPYQGPVYQPRTEGREPPRTGRPTDPSTQKMPSNRTNWQPVEERPGASEAGRNWDRENLPPDAEVISSVSRPQYSGVINPDSDVSDVILAEQRPHEARANHGPEQLIARFDAMSGVEQQEYLGSLDEQGRYEELTALNEHVKDRELGQDQYHSEELADRNSVSLKLKEGRVTDTQYFVTEDGRPDGKNGAMRLTFEDGTHGVYKAKRGENKNLRAGVRAGTFFQREVAASQLAELLGFDDIVPATVFRNDVNGIGSVQQFVDGSKAWRVADGERFDGDEDAARAAVFDYLLCNGDRHQANWMVKDGKLTLIDHGLSIPFKYVSNDLNRLEFWKQAVAKGYDVPDLSGWGDKWGQIDKMLKGSGIDDAARKLTKQRFDALVANGGKKIADLPGFVNGWTLQQLVQENG